MAISTQTKALIELYNQKISQDLQQLSQIKTIQKGYTIVTGAGTSDQIRIFGSEEAIENYDLSIKSLDNKILEINNKIADLKETILTIGEDASSVGCGTTSSSVNVTSPSISCKVYAFSGNNPFSETTATLSTSNLGIGVSNKVSNSSIGNYNADIEICYSGGCSGAPGGSCVAAAASITYFENQISPLVTERNNLITKVNFLKNARSSYELQRYAYENTIAQINTSIGISSSIISFLTDPANDEWL